MPQSESIENLTIALVQAQSEFTTVPKSKTGQEGLRKFKYADLADVVSMVTPRLNKYKIFLSQPIITDGNGGIRQTTRLQLGAEFIQTDGIKLADDTPGKNLGISVTYARRIDLNGLLGIAPDEDVDAPDLKAEEPKQTTHTQWKTVKSASEVKQTLGEKITDADLPSEMFAETTPNPSAPLPDDLKQTAIQMENFVALTEARNTEIQNKLKDLVNNKVVNRKSLALFLDKEHEGKKQFDVPAEKWESTIKKIEDAVSDGTIKEVLKG